MFRQFCSCSGNQAMNNTAAFVIQNCLEKPQFCVMNDKKGHKIAALLISQKACCICSLDKIFQNSLEPFPKKMLLLRPEGKSLIKKGKWCHFYLLSRFLMVFENIKKSHRFR